MKKSVSKFTASSNSKGRAIDVRASQCPTVLLQAVVLLRRSEAIQTGDRTPTCPQAVNTHCNRSKLNRKSASRFNAVEKIHKYRPIHTRLGTTTIMGNESCPTSASLPTLRTPSPKSKTTSHFSNNFHAPKTTPSCSTRSPS